MLFVLEILRVMPALLFNGTGIVVYTPYGIVPMTLMAGQSVNIRVPDLHTILTFQHRRRKVSYHIVDLLDTTSVNFAPLPLIVQFNIYRKIKKSDVRATLIGHRGSGSDGYRKEHNMTYLRDNSIESFKQAFAAGVEWVESDVHMTSDGEIVLFHDYTINDIPIWDMTWADFKRKAPHYSKLHQALTELDGRLKMIVELKYPSAEEITENKLGSAPNMKKFVSAVLEIIHKQKEGRIRIASFEPDIMLLMRASDANLELFFLTEGLPDKYADHRRNTFGDAIQFCSENDIQGIITDTETLTSNPIHQIAAAQEAGLQLMAYWWRSLNGSNTMVSEVVNLDCARVDGLLVDDISLVKTIMNNMETCEWTKDKNLDRRRLQL